MKIKIRPWGMSFPKPLEPPPADEWVVINRLVIGL